MSHKEFIYCWQKWLLPIVVRIVVTICLTVGVLGILGSTASTSNAQALFPDSVTANAQLVSTTKRIQDKQTPSKSTPLNATVYHSPECNCCGGWIDHLKTQGFEITDFSTPDIETVKQKYNVPDNLSSCHTAIVNGYVIEGHVPANDIKRLLQEKPNVVGLSVPQMPVGTPGMEMGNRKDPFTVFAFDGNKSVAVFNKYPSS
ncbi:DUF411 domain-containing protein [Nostoc sp. ATCC 53789]|jgi:hypothetical protein|uniref:DUF411 domain-containing protein n=1 Tax=Nostoc sp. ATCC 53789 TaxID=76335 RepID=UPI000DEC4DF6|nr:DUF411 domain-containing protein [Nostoc sp. ATCC 53789]QHG15723.1 DUF411 domain-containing protein [Nostoc sp. ATCC 53789]RCJ22029.1 hypothetical protein A6V25_24315 [Nostoc sp. ATCC 53789]